MRKVSLQEQPMTNSLAYLLCQEAKRSTDYRPGMTPEEARAVSNRVRDIRDIGTVPTAHTTALPQEHPVTNSLAYLLCQTKRSTDYRPGMTPEDVRAVSKKSVRQHETTRPQEGRHQTRLSILRDTNDTMPGHIPLIQRDRIVTAL